MVVMNADATAGIDATTVFGARISNFVTFAWIGFAFGVLSLLGGGFLLYWGLRRPGTVGDAGKPTQPPGEYRTPPDPAELEGSTTEAD